MNFLESVAMTGDDEGVGELDRFFGSEKVFPLSVEADKKTSFLPPLSPSHTTLILEPSAAIPGDEDTPAAEEISFGRANVIPPSLEAVNHILSLSDHTTYTAPSEPAAI